MVSRKAVMTRMFVHCLRGMKHREPSRKDWDTGSVVLEALEIPCRLVVVSQDKGH